jgi:ArsR family transcriptional regulator
MEAVFKALADQTRLRILGLLAAGEVCVCEIHESLRIPQPTASRHLAYLRRAGLVTDRRDGLWVHYRLATPSDDVVRTVLDSTTHCLTHLPTTARDRQRLCRRTGRALKVRHAAPALACCSPQS